MIVSKKICMEYEKEISRLRKIIEEKTSSEKSSCTGSTSHTTTTAANTTTTATTTTTTAANTPTTAANTKTATTTTTATAATRTAEETTLGQKQPRVLWSVTVWAQRLYSFSL